MNGEEIPLTHGVTLCEDGKYRWIHSVSLYKNPTFFFLIWKIFSFIILGVFVFTSVIDAADDRDFFWAGLLSSLKFFGVVFAGMTVLVSVGYLIYAVVMGGRYTVEFEMDENGVNHAQIASQAKKARRIGQAAAAAGMAAGSFSALGAGAASARTEMYSDFSKVRAVKAYPRRSLIKVNCRLDHNQVYASKEDFEFVKNFIVSHCPRAKIK